MKNNEMSELEELRHSAAHVMAAAICRIYPNVKLDIGPPTSEGRFATSLLCARAEYEGVEMPLAQAVNAILNHNAPLTDTIKAILSRTAYSE